MGKEIKYLQVGRILRKKMLNYSPLKEKVGSKIYPLVADKGTTFPFIIYRRESSQPSSNKDKLLFDIDSTVSIIIATDNYTQSIEIAELVLDCLSIAEEDTEIELINTDERYQEETFIQQLTYKIKIK